MRLWILGLLLLAAPLVAKDVIGDTAGVQILREKRHDSEGQHYGYNYHARNRNDYPVYVSVQLAHATNAYDGLLPGSIIVRGDETAPLGYVVQDSVSEDANWDIVWQTEPLNQ